VIIIQFQNPLPVVPRDQEGFYSCWATSAEMIMEFIGGVRVRQCVQASRPGADSGCCDAYGNLARNPDCDAPSLPEFGRWGYGFKHRFQQALNWNEITNEINGGRPFAFSLARIDPENGTVLPISHMMVAIGYNDDGAGQQAIICLNPRPFRPTDQILLPLSEYKGVNTATVDNVYVHEHDYYMIQPSL